MRGRGKRDLSLAQQLLFLRSNPIVGGTGGIKRRKLTWATIIQPTALSRTYTARISLCEGKTPDVYIDDPQLSDLAQGRLIPHVYTEPLRLCLYLPGTEEWGAHKRIDQTIIPWTYLWLLYFEEWLASDDWKGGGQHPCDEEKPRGNRQTRRSLARF